MQQPRNTLVPARQGRPIASFGLDFWTQSARTRAVLIGSGRHALSHPSGSTTVLKSISAKPTRHGAKGKTAATAATADPPAFPAIVSWLRDQKHPRLGLPTLLKNKNGTFRLTFFLISSFQPSSRVMILGVDAVAMIPACGLGIGLAWLVAAASSDAQVKRMENGKMSWMRRLIRMSQIWEKPEVRCRSTGKQRSAHQPWAARCRALCRMDRSQAEEKSTLQ